MSSVNHAYVRSTTKENIKTYHALRERNDVFVECVGHQVSEPDSQHFTDKTRSDCPNGTQQTMLRHGQYTTHGQQPFTKGSFTIVDIYLLVQSVLKGEGGQGSHTNFFNVGRLQNMTC